MVCPTWRTFLCTFSRCLRRTWFTFLSCCSYKFRYRYFYIIFWIHIFIRDTNFWRSIPLYFIILCFDVITLQIEFAKFLPIVILLFQNCLLVSCRIRQHSGFNQLTLWFWKIILGSVDSSGNVPVFDFLVWFECPVSSSFEFHVTWHL